MVNISEPSGSTPTDRSRFLMLTPVLPASRADNAGGRYVYWIERAVSERFDVLVLAPDSPSSRRAYEMGEVPRHRLLRPTPVVVPIFVNRMITRWLSLVAPAHASLPYVRELLRDKEARDAILRADVIDLQWQEQGALIPLLRRLNRHARIVCTFHDVLSQRFARARDSAESGLRRARWTWATAAARMIERQILNRADAVIVLSEKDALLLPPGKAEIHVVTPPLAIDAGSVNRSLMVPGEILFVGFIARWENEEGLLWFLAHAWPLIKARIPHARFRIVGLGIRDDLRKAAHNAGVELLGFVPELKPLYDQASVVVVPLRLGAGVKFKVVEAILAGVPVVTTPVGAEGIGDRSWFAGLTEDAPSFAEAVIKVLSDPVAATARAGEVRKEALHQYGWPHFEKTVSEAYGRPEIKEADKESKH